MLYKIYNFLVKRPIFVLIVTILLSIFIGQFATKLQIDASSETLMLNNDKDLNFAREMAKRFTSPDFLVVTYSPNDELLSQKSLSTLEDLTEKLSKIDQVQTVTSILNVPLLQSPVINFKDITKSLPTIENKIKKNEDLNKTLIKKEFLTSPLYKSNLVSTDFKTTAIILSLKNDKQYFSLLEKRNMLLEKEQNATISQEEKKQLLKISEEFKDYRDHKRQVDHENIQLIRDVLQQYKANAKVFLGGVSMIADDMITYVKSDIFLYGSSLLILLILTLGIIFRQIRWVLVPIIICAVSLLLTTGFLGFLGLEITVISSNFISLQLIITLSLTIHLIVQYQEYAQKYQKTSQNRIILATLLQKSSPSFFAIITTLAGFSSLVFSDILPIINLGIMMSIGICISLIVSFCLFASINALLDKKIPRARFSPKYSLTIFCSKIIKNYGTYIIIVSILTLIVGVTGAFKLQVENSFINYFKKSTEIYKGMKIIDQQLGGTTPLDVILTFKEPKEVQLSDDDFENEFQEAGNDEKYWFTYQKIQLIKKVNAYLKSLPQIANVQSLNTMLSVGKILNDGKDLDSFEIALLYKELPQKYKTLFLNPFVNIENNQVRFNTRIMDSNPDLRRDELIKKINHDLQTLVPLEIASFRLSSFMILYNNMLQSLYQSQIVTLGFVILILTLMFWVLFRCLKTALIAIVSNLIPMSMLFGFMGLANIPLDMMSITIAAISIGIGVDNTIHYIHRFKQEYYHTKDYVKAMENSHKTIAYAMFYTSFTIILGFSVLIVSNFIPTIYFGLLTVFVMSMVLIGALLLLPKMLLIFKPFK